MSKKLIGTGVALITPFDRERKIDFKSLERLVNLSIEGGVDYLVILGTTGENVTLTNEEKKEVVACVISSNAKKLPLVLGIGGNNTKDVIKKIYGLKIDDFEAILSVTPYYNRPSQEGIYQHFKAIAENTSKNILLYNVPSRTGSNISPVTVLQLSKNFRNIVGIKEASGSIRQSYEIIKSKPVNFSVISGDDTLSLPIILGGGEGVISVIAQAIPRKFSNMIRYILNGKIKEAYSIYYSIFDLIRLIYEEGNPSGIKSLLKSADVCETYLRLPLLEASEKLKKKINNAYFKNILPY